MPWSFRLQLREQNHVADAFLAEEHHAQAINANAAGLKFQWGPLRDEIVLLGVAGLNFLAVDVALENLDGRRVVWRKLGERHEFFGQMRDERGLNQSWFDEFGEHGVKMTGQIHF